MITTLLIITALASILVGGCVAAASNYTGPDDEIARFLNERDPWTSL